MMYAVLGHMYRVICILIAFDVDVNVSNGKKGIQLFIMLLCWEKKKPLASWSRSGME